jgi:hypothetical protein
MILFRRNFATPLMRRLHCLTAIVLLVAHAVLGCCAHHACAWMLATGHMHDAYTSHDHSSDHDHDSCDPPADHNHGPVAACTHGSCSFVKADPVRVDDGSERPTWGAAALPIIAETFCPAWGAIEAANILADSCSARLYVCYCALVI